jgi:hypothetical protein
MYRVVRVRVGINNDVDTEVVTSEAVKEMEVLGIDQDRIYLGMLEDVGDVIGFQPVVDGCDRYQILRVLLRRRWGNPIVPTLTAPAAPMPKRASKNAGVLVARMPTRLKPCFLR